MPPSAKKAKGKQKLVDTQGVGQEGSILAGVEDIKSRIEEIMAVTKESKVPLGLKKALGDCFKCSVCTGPIVPPVIVTKCCKTILGCETCVNSWYSGEDALFKTCPKCRASRGYNETMILRGLDTILEVYRKIEGIEPPSPAAPPSA